MNLWLDLYLIHKILSLTSTLFGLLLGFLVYFYNRGSKINKYFALISFSFSIFWVHQFYTTSSLAKISLNYAIWNLRLGLFGAAITALAVFYFCLYFPKESKIHLWLKNFITYLCIFLAFFCFSPFFVKKILINEEHNVLEGAVYGWGKYLYFPSLILIILVALWIVIKKYFFLNQEEKLKTQYFLSGFVFSVVANVIGNILYPLVGSIILPIGNYSTLVFLILTAWAITHYRLFEIKLILTELLVGVFAILLFVQIFLSNSTFEYIWSSILFIVFLFFGYVFIKSILKEIKIKERIGELSWEVVERGKKVAQNFKQVMADREKLFADKERLLKEWFFSDVNKELEINTLRNKIKELEEKLKEKKK